MGEILSSWKEIAEFLGKGVRTAQRWERELGLPVRRPPGKDSRVVFALREELTAWVKAQPYSGTFSAAAAARAANVADLPVIAAADKPRPADFNKFRRAS